MNSLYDWVRNHKFITVILVGLAVLLFFWGIPMLISASFVDERGILVHWQAGDFLQFYGAFLAFTGTTILGIVSWIQNRNIKNEMNLLERNRVLSEYRPDFLISQVVSDNTYGWDKLTVGDVWNNQYTIMQFRIDNIGNGIARSISIYLYIDDKRHCVSYKANDVPDLINGLPSSRKIDVNSMARFAISVDCEIVQFQKIILKGTECSLVFSFYDYFQNKYEQRYDFLVEDIHHGNNAPAVDDSERKFGRYFDILVVKSIGTSYPKLMETSKDFDKSFLVK